MSGFPSGISLVRSVPQHLVEGYTSGEYRLWGGVLRRAVDPGQGQIVGFLTEGADLARLAEQNLPLRLDALQAAVGNVQMASQLAAGMGVLNLGVQVVGFAMVMRRLDRISRQIEAIHGDLRRVGANVDWLVMSDLAALRARAENAIATANRAVRQRDPHLLNDAKTISDLARRQLVHLCEDMLAGRRAVPQRSLFAEFVNMAALVTFAEALCVEGVEGAGQAAADLAENVADLRAVADGFRRQVSEFRSNPLELLRLGQARREETRDLAGRMDDVVRRLEGYVPQLRLQHALGLDAAGWRALVAPEGGGPLTCIVADDPNAGDLLELVAANLEP
jgi:hypothetical protein